MGYQPRLLEKFENVGGTVSQLMPDAEYEWQSRQALRNPYATISGASYGYRYGGATPAPKALAYETVSCSILATPGQDPDDVDTTYDDLKSKLWSIGQGKIYTLDSLGVRRWAYASLVAMPQMQWRAGMIWEISLVIDFVRESDWYSTTLTTSSATLGSDPTIANAGNAPVYNAILTIGGTYTDPVLTNTSLLIPNTALNYKLATLRDGTNANHQVKFDAGANTVQYTATGGAPYADDYSNYVRQAGQVHLMVLQPGDNVFSRSGVSASSTLYWQFYPAYL